MGKSLLQTIEFVFFLSISLSFFTYTVAGAEQRLESARILDVHPTLPVVVVDVGVRHGARIGMPYVVIRNDLVVAKLRLDDVRNFVSAATVERVMSGIMVASSDRIQIINTKTIW